MSDPYSGRPCPPAPKPVEPELPTCPACDTGPVRCSSHDGRATLFWSACPACLMRGPAIPLRPHDPTTARRLADQAWADLPRA